MTLYLKKLSFIESYPFKCQGRRYYNDIKNDIKNDSSLLKLKLDLAICKTIKEETNIKNDIMYEQFINSLKNKYRI